MPTRRKIFAGACGLLALVLLLSFGATSIFANDSQDGANGLRPGFRQKTMGHRGDFNKNGRANMFDKLVTDKVLTQEQADKIGAYLEEKTAERKAQMEKLKAMTPEERKTYFEANKDKNRPDLLAELVAAGIITQEKSDEIAKLLPAKKGNLAPKGQRGPGTRGNRMCQ